MMEVCSMLFHPANTSGANFGRLFDASVREREFHVFTLRKKQRVESRVIGGKFAESRRFT